MPFKMYIVFYHKFSIVLKLQLYLYTMTLFNPFALMKVREMSIYIFVEKKSRSSFPLAFSKNSALGPTPFWRCSWNVYPLYFLFQIFWNKRTTRLKRLLVSTIVQWITNHTSLWKHLITAWQLTHNCLTTKYQITAWQLLYDCPITSWWLYYHV